MNALRMSPDGHAGRVLTDLYWTRERFDTRIDLDKLGLVSVNAPPCYEWYQDVVDFAARVADLSPETGMKSTTSPTRRRS